MRDKDLKNYQSNLLKELECVERKIEFLLFGIPERLEEDLGIAKESIDIDMTLGIQGEQVDTVCSLDNLLEKKYELIDELLKLE